MHQNYDSLVVRYEALCTRTTDQFERIKRFVSSPIPTDGSEITWSWYTDAKDVSRDHSYTLDTYGSKTTDKNVFRWKKEEDSEVLEKAHAFASLMGEYCEYWGY